MELWPALDGSGRIPVCPKCSPPAISVAPLSTPRAPTWPTLRQPPEAAPTDSNSEATTHRELPDSSPLSQETVPHRASPRKRPPAPPKAGNRFRDLTAKPGEVADKARWPDSLLEDLPEEARSLLAGAKDEAPPASPPLAPEARPPKVPDHVASVLKAQGYTIQEDARGVRIGGHPTGRLRGTDGLSASDVVRMAADLDGGVPPPEKVRRCPKCDAVIPVDSQRCQWCGAAFPPPGDSRKS